MRGIDEAPERGVATVASFDREIVLVVVAMVRRALLQGAEPERVAAEARDVVDVFPDSVERPAVQRGRRSRRGKVAARAGETVDHHLVDDGVVSPVGGLGVGSKSQLLT